MYRMLTAAAALLAAILVAPAASALPADDASFIDHLSREGIEVDDIVHDVAQAEVECLFLHMPETSLRTVIVNYIETGKTVREASIYTLSGISAYCPEFMPSREQFIRVVGSVGGG